MLKNLALLLFLGASLACAQSVTIQNPGFETATLPFNAGHGPYSNILAGSIAQTGGTLPGWVAAGTTNNAIAGGYDPIGLPIPQWWTGTNIGYIYEFAPGAVSLSQSLSATLQNGTTYTLSALIGAVPGYIFNYAIQLWAGSTLLASSSNLEGSPNFVFGT